MTSSRPPGPQQTDPKEYTSDVTEFCGHVARVATASRRRACAWGPLRAGATSTTRASRTSGSTSRTRAPGPTTWALEADPENRIWEGGGAAESNAPTFAAQQVTVPGWVAAPVSLNQSGGPQVVPVTAQQFGTESVANLRYRIVSAPSHGSLNVPVNGTFGAGQQLVYTPSAGYTGSDSFTYAAFSAIVAVPDQPAGRCGDRGGPDEDRSRSPGPPRASWPGRAPSSPRR